VYLFSLISYLMQLLQTLGEDGTKLTGKKKKGALTGEEERVLAGRQKIGERGFDIQQLTYEVSLHYLT